MWPFRRKRVHVEVSRAVRAQREEAQKNLAAAMVRFEEDDKSTIRPLRQMVRENHVGERLDYLVQKVRGNDPGAAHR